MAARSPASFCPETTMNELVQPPVIRALLVDDEPAARRGLRLLLSRHDDFEVVGECSSADDIAPAIGRSSPDVVFLDVRMPGGTGIDALRSAPGNGQPLVVLVTAFEEHALAAFDIEAIDYLLKPFSDEDFERAVGRVRRHLERIRAREATRRIAEALGRDAPSTTGPGSSAERRGPDEPRAGAEPQEHFAIRYGGRIRLVAPDSIRWVGAQGDYVRIHTLEDEHLLRETMRNMQERLTGHGFVRIHRSTLVHAEFIREIRARGGGRYAAVLQDGTRRNISRRGQERLQRALGIDL